MPQRRWKEDPVYTNVFFVGAHRPGMTRTPQTALTCRNGGLAARLPVASRLENSRPVGKRDSEMKLVVDDRN